MDALSRTNAMIVVDTKMFNTNEEEIDCPERLRVIKDITFFGLIPTTGSFYKYINKKDIENYTYVAVMNNNYPDRFYFDGKFIDVKKLMRPVEETRIELAKYIPIIKEDYSDNGTLHKIKRATIPNTDIKFKLGDVVEVPSWTWTDDCSYFGTITRIEDCVLDIRGYYCIYINGEDTYYKSSDIIAWYRKNRKGTLVKYA